MTQFTNGWGAPPSDRYETLAAPFRPVFARIRDRAASRDSERTLPFEEIGFLREVGFPRLRLPVEQGGFGATLPELFALLTELSEADPNVTNAVRAHAGFVEDLLTSPDHAWRERWLARIAQGGIAGAGTSEAGDAKVGTFSTTIVQNGGDWRLNGEKFYSTGSLFADWIHVSAQDDAGEVVTAIVPTNATGVEILDDWDGFGQALTASGTARFKDVVVPADAVNPSRERFAHAISFFQLYHLATLAGIARAAADEAGTLVAQRQRVYSTGNAATARTDPQILQVVGRVRSAAYGAGAIVAKAAEGIERIYQARHAPSSERDETVAIVNTEVNGAVSIVTDLVLNATTHLFDALGASATRRGLGLDRHWRNARTISSHNPRIYRERSVGDWAVNRTAPPTAYRVGSVA